MTQLKNYVTQSFQQICPSNKGFVQYSTMPIVFNGRGTTKPDIAFQHMVILAKQLDGKITYR